MYLLGPTGDHGEVGEPGLKGEMGIRGKRGNVGLPGLMGPKAEHGDPLVVPHIALSSNTFTRISWRSW